jgi:hypothetical protein
MAKVKAPSIAAVQIAAGNTIAGVNAWTKENWIQWATANKSKLDSFKAVRLFFVKELATIGFTTETKGYALRVHSLSMKGARYLKLSKYDSKSGEKSLYKDDAAKTRSEKKVSALTDTEKAHKANLANSIAALKLLGF